MSGHLMKSIAFAFISPDIAMIESAAGKRMNTFGQTFGVTPHSEPNPARTQRERDLMLSLSNRPRVEGTSSTLLTGQTGATGQPKVRRPTLLGG